MNFIKTIFSKLLSHKLLLMFGLGIVVVPILAYKNMVDRVAGEANLKLLDIDDKIPGLKLQTSSKSPRSVIIYQDGTSAPTEAFGLLTLTWEEFKQAPERFNGTGVVWTSEVFPVLAYFNSSGFDATGSPVLIRSAKDGKILFQSATKVEPVRLVLVQRDGTFKVLTRGGEWLSVKNEEWHKSYMAQGDLLPPETLANLSDEKLKEMGYVRIPKNTSGILGHVIKVGGNVNAVEPALGAIVKVFAGRVSPSTTDKKLVKTVIAKDGTFTLELPGGEYTLTVEEGGKLFGNAFDQTSWPSVTIEANKWIEYEFRRSP